MSSCSATNEKGIENRRWSTRFRGAFYVHAAKGMTRDEYDDAVAFARDVNPALVVPAFAALDRGGIIGRARLVDVVPPCSTEPSLFWRPCGHPWHMTEQFGFVLADVEALPFRALRGELGFFRVPSERAPAGATRVVHRGREPFDIDIGRPSKWGNPFPVPAKDYDREADPDRILARYEAHVRGRPDLMAALPELRGKTLGCWCAPKKCHGDVLAKLVEEVCGGK